MTNKHHIEELIEKFIGNFNKQSRMDRLCMGSSDLRACFTDIADAAYSQGLADERERLRDLLLVPGKEMMLNSADEEVGKLLAKHLINQDE